MNQNVNALLEQVKQRLIEWLAKKPSGSFTIKLEINQGGIRSKKVGIIEDIN